MRILLMMIAIIALPACTSLLLGNTSTPERTSDRATAPSAADTTISGEIRRRIDADEELNAYPIGIRTVSGNVTLSGTVGSYPMRDRAVKIARETDGVLRVDNRIIVNTNL